MKILHWLPNLELYNETFPFLRRQDPELGLLVGQSDQPIGAV